MKRFMTFALSVFFLISSSFCAYASATPANAQIYDLMTLSEGDIMPVSGADWVSVYYNRVDWVATPTTEFSGSVYHYLPSGYESIGFRNTVSSDYFSTVSIRPRSSFPETARFGIITAEESVPPSVFRFDGQLTSDRYMVPIVGQTVDTMLSVYAPGNSSQFNFVQGFRVGSAATSVRNGKNSLGLDSVVVHIGSSSNDTTLPCYPFFVGTDYYAIGLDGFSFVGGNTYTFNLITSGTGPDNTISLLYNSMGDGFSDYISEWSATVTDYNSNNQWITLSFKCEQAINGSMISFGVNGFSPADSVPAAVRAKYCFITDYSYILTPDDGGSGGGDSSLLPYLTGIMSKIDGISGGVTNIITNITNSTTTITNSISNAVSNIVQNANDNTNKVVQSQNENADKVVQSQKENADNIIQNQKENTDKMVEEESKQFDSLKNDYDTGGMDSNNETLSSALDEYGQMEDQIVDQIVQPLQDFTFDNPLTQYLAAFRTCGDFMQSLFTGSGAFQDVINLSFILMIALIVAGLYRFKGGN